MDMRLEDGRLILAPVQQARRAGWAEASRAVAAARDDALVWPQFGNAGDAELSEPSGEPADGARGEIWLAALDPTVGSEIQSTSVRDRLPSEMHDHLRTVTVAPMTTGSHAAPYRIPLRFRRWSGLILLDQLRTLDKLRLVRRLGTVDARTLCLTLAALREMFEE